MQNAAKIVAHLGDLLVTVLGVLLQRLVNYRLQTGRHRIGPHFGELPRRTVKHLVADVDHRFTLESPDTGKHFVEENAGRENVRAGIGSLAFRLFRRGVSRRAIWNSKLGYLGSIVSFILRGVFVLKELGEAKIEDLRLPAWRHHHVSGLNVTVNNVFRMRVGERIGHLDGDRKRASKLEWSSRNQLPDVLSLDVLHRYIEDAVSFVEIVYCADVRVVELGAELGFAFEASEV